jgi:hypothetical protein
MAAGVASDGLVESLHAASSTIAADMRTPTSVLPRRVVYREIITVSAFPGMVIDSRLLSFLKHANAAVP